MSGSEAKRAKKVAKLAAELGDGDNLLTTEVLERLGFSLPRVSMPLATGEGVTAEALGEPEFGPLGEGMEAQDTASDNLDSG